MQVKIVTPEKELYNEKAKSLSVPTEVGRITILPNHIEMISILKAGDVFIESEKGKKKIFIEGGVVEVFKNNVNLLLKKGKL
jgi:F-type H+-transporting ATPase subunit epsilon